MSLSGMKVYLSGMHPGFDSQTPTKYSHFLKETLLGLGLKG
jgi:hypothetical protein